MPSSSRPGGHAETTSTRTAASVAADTGPAADLPAVAVVLASRDRPGQLAAALVAVRAALGPRDELVVVDSASTTGATAAVCTAAAVRMLRMDRPGASFARNAGVAATSAPLLAFTDDDCRPQPGWSAALAAGFADPTVGLVTGSVGSVGSGVAVSVFTAAPLRVTGGGAAGAVVTTGKLGHGANMAVRRAAFDAVGGFDVALGAGAARAGSEDQDLFLRLLLAGWDAVVTPDAIVDHVAWRGRRAALAAAYGYGAGQGALARKHRSARPGRAPHLDPALARRLAVQGLWDDGLAAAWRDLRAGYQLGALSGLARALGTGRGLLTSRRTWR